MSASLDPALARAYEEQYTDELAAWREVCAKYKAANILDVCRGQRFRRALDCGAGEGSVLGFLHREAGWEEFCALEISDSGLARIRARRLDRLADARKFDGYRIPYPDRSFDVAVCSHVIEHVEHPRLLLRELKRVATHQVFEIPLEYAPAVDERVRELLAYGHINVYTPSLFKFLLRSEGFEILSEKRSLSAPEVVRYDWYRNRKLRPSLARELGLALYPLLQRLRRLRRGRAWLQEHGYTAYTCLARGRGELKVLESAGA